MNDDEDNLNDTPKDPTKSPSIASEEASEESVDIDAALEKVGLNNDESGAKPLDLEDELEEEL